MKFNNIEKNRLSELLKQAIDGLLEDDREDSIEYLYSTMEMTLSELQYFGIELTQEELNEYDWKK